MAQITWALRKVPNGYEGMVQVPAGAIQMPSGKVRPPKPISVKAKHKTPAGAVRDAAHIVDAISKNPIVKAALPPGSGAAIQATKLIASKGPAALKVVTGPGAKRLAKALKFW